jgi:hypothetical protein
MKTTVKSKGRHTMRTTVKPTAAVLLVIFLTGVAQAQPKLSCVKDVVYGKEFLSKFPDAGSSCQEVQVLRGEKWVRFDAQVKHNKDHHMTVDFLNTKGDHTGKPMTFAYTPDANLTLENKDVKAATAVEEGDKVMLWVPESRFGLYAQPGAVESKQFKLVSDDSSKQR